MGYYIMLKWVIHLTVQVYQVHNTISLNSVLIFNSLYSCTQLQTIAFLDIIWTLKIICDTTEYLKTDFQYRNNIMYADFKYIFK